MSRLADRILSSGCSPLRPYDLFSPDDLEEHVAEIRELATGEGQPLGPQHTARAIQLGQPTAVEILTADEVAALPVIAGDEVAEYCQAFAANTDPDDVVSVLAPPFDRFFVEFQGVPGTWLHAWGVLFDAGWLDPGDDSEVRWHISARLVLEPRKGHPIGPAATWIFALDHEGRWLRHRVGEQDEYVSGMWLPRMDIELPEDVAAHFLQRTVPLMLPALMTLSFMHCRNVQAREVDPPELLSRKWRRKRGRSLVRYHVLEIAPMRRVLDDQGEAHKRGLGHAVHMCRGHFKTFTEEAPLFGRVTGDFWWADHVRGRSEHGAVLKDYRVQAPGQDLGRPYNDVDVEATTAPRSRTVFDPDAAGRGRQAHNRTQNQLANAVREAGLRPRRPAADEPNYDLAWQSDDVVVVAEVKSLTVDNEERQLRLAIGQVVRYRYQIAANDRTVQALIAVERAPSDPSWLDLCNEHGIILAWPELFRQAVQMAGHAEPS